MSATFPKRGEVYWVDLDPTIGTEINKTRPGLIISNNLGNELSNRVIIAPVTSSASKVYSFEVKILINNIIGKILLDQIRTIDKKRLKKKITTLDKETIAQVDAALKISLALL